MKYPIVFAACAVLAACGSAEVEEPVVDDASMAPSQDLSLTAAAEMAGTYEVTMDDETVATQTLNPDGTYSESIDGEVTETGTWRQDGLQLCYTAQDAASESCYTGGATAEDGSYEVTDADGNVTATVRRLEE